MRSDSMTVQEALQWGSLFLERKSVEDARLEAEVLLAFVMHETRAGIFASLKDKIDYKVFERYKLLVNKRAERFPLQYLTCEQEFMSLPFKVEEGVLIPRNDTEVLIEGILNKKENFKNILDVGTGTGVIAVLLARKIPESRIMAMDISEKSIKLAKKNAEKHSVADRINFIRADIFTWEPDSKFNLIVSNPPYIRSAGIKFLQEEVRFEPREALDGGLDGLSFYQRLLYLAGKYLELNGMLALEIGYDQAREVTALIEQKPGFEVEEIIKDYGGKDRAVISVKTAGGRSGAE